MQFVLCVHAICNCILLSLVVFVSCCSHSLSFSCSSSAILVAISFGAWSSKNDVFFYVISSFFYAVDAFFVDFVFECMCEGTEIKVKYFSWRLFFMFICHFQFVFGVNPIYPLFDCTSNSISFLHQTSYFYFSRILTRCGAAFTFCLLYDWRWNSTNFIIFHFLSARSQN